MESDGKRRLTLVEKVCCGEGKVDSVLPLIRKRIWRVVFCPSIVVTGQKKDNVVCILMRFSEDVLEGGNEY